METHPHPLSSAPDFRRHPFVVWWRNLGGGSLALSVALHAGVLIVAGLVVFNSRKVESNVDFLPGGGTAQGMQASEDLHAKISNKRQKPIHKTQEPARVVGGQGPVLLPAIQPEIVNVPDASSATGGSIGPSGGFGASGKGNGMGPGTGPGAQLGNVAPPPFLKARCSSVERLDKLRKNGGNTQCEVAVSRSLEWLKTKQNPDGSWGTGYKSAMTGLALLCYLGRCETNESPFYGDNVMKAILYLVELSKKNDRGFITEDLKTNAGAYEHGIATYALGEMYTLARLGSKSLPGMREAFENGVKQIVESQNEMGGWDYYVKNVMDGGSGKSTRDDLSVTGWQYQALKAARHTGLKIAGLEPAIEKTLKYMEKAQTKDGGIGTVNREAPYNQWNLTGTGVLGLQTLGNGGRQATVDKGMKFLRRFVTEEPLDWNRNCNLYCWYYYTQAFFQKGGEDWKFYNEQLLPQLLENQNVDGSWKPERANSQVAAVNEKESGVYKTALCVLQLEVYYRYLKVADREEKSVFER